MADARAVQAREAHRLAGDHGVLAQQYRDRRNRLVRQLRDEDPFHWTYAALARAVGISPEMAAAIVKGRTGNNENAPPPCAVTGGVGGVAGERTGG